MGNIKWNSQGLGVMNKVKLMGYVNLKVIP